MALKKGGSLACVRPTRREECPGTAQGWEGMKQPAPQDTQTRSRLFIGENGPSDSALAAASGWRLLAAQPLTGTRRAALLGTCARAAPLGAIRPRWDEAISTRMGILGVAPGGSCSASCVRRT